jgi:hypothetical protein
MNVVNQAWRDWGGKGRMVGDGENGGENWESGERREE